jgi:hypothetical protein
VEATSRAACAISPFFHVCVRGAQQDARPPPVSTLAIIPVTTSIPLKPPPAHLNQAQAPQRVHRLNQLPPRRH